MLSNLVPAETRSAFVAGLTALAIALPSAPALAWGQREQDFLKGAVGALVLKAIIDDAKRDKHAKPVYRDPPPRPRYEEVPPVTSIYRTPVARAFNSYSASERRLIQKRLAYWGYYRGRADGDFGPGTYSAVTAYAHDQGQARDLASTAGAYAVFDGLIF